MLGLAILSLEPVGVVEQGLDVALLPARLLSEAARPVGWLRMPRVRAAEQLLEARLASDFARRQELFRDSEQVALPDPARFPGRRFVLAEVVDRDPQRLDIGGPPADDVLIQLCTGTLLLTHRPVPRDAWGPYFRAGRVEIGASRHEGDFSTGIRRDAIALGQPGE